MINRLDHIITNTIIWGIIVFLLDFMYRGFQLSFLTIYYVLWGCLIGAAIGYLEPIENHRVREF